MNGWKRWFAWRPVYAENLGHSVWFRTVEYETTIEGRPTGALGSGPHAVTRYRVPNDAPEFWTRSR